MGRQWRIRKRRGISTRVRRRSSKSAAGFRASHHPGPSPCRLGHGRRPCYCVCTQVPYLSSHGLNGPSIHCWSGQNMVDSGCSTGLLPCHFACWCVSTGQPGTSKLGWWLGGWGGPGRSAFGRRSRCLGWASAPRDHNLVPANVPVGNKYEVLATCPTFRLFQARQPPRLERASSAAAAARCLLLHAFAEFRTSRHFSAGIYLDCPALHTQVQTPRREKKLGCWALPLRETFPLIHPTHAKTLT